MEIKFRKDINELRSGGNYQLARQKKRESIGFPDGYFATVVRCFASGSCSGLSYLTPG
jgi:hypothetical protein